MKIEKVAVLGAGAVGSYVIWGLSQKKEIRLGVIAGSAGCMSEVWCFTGSNGQHPYGSGRKYDGNESDERSGQ